MSRRGEGQLFVGRLSKSTRVRDLEDVFEPYGRMARCDIKYGAEMAYAFVDFEDRRDAEDAIKYENGRDIVGSTIIVEWAKGNPRRTVVSKGYDECYRCHRSGHWARDCPEDRNYGFGRSGRSSGRYRSPSPKRRRRSRSRSDSRERRRRRSRSHSRGRRSRSRSDDRKRSSRRRSRSHSKSNSCSRSKSKSLPPKSRSRSKSTSAEPVNGDNRSEPSRSDSASD